MTTDPRNMQGQSGALSRGRRRPTHLWYVAQQEDTIASVDACPHASSEAIEETSEHHQDDCSLCHTVLHNLSRSCLCQRCGRVVCSSCARRAPGSEDDFTDLHVHLVNGDDFEKHGILSEVVQYKHNTVCLSCHSRLSHVFHEAVAMKSMKDEIRKVQTDQASIMSVLSEMQVSLKDLRQQTPAQPLALRGAPSPVPQIASTANFAPRPQVPESAQRAMAVPRPLS